MENNFKDAETVIQFLFLQDGTVECTLKNLTAKRVINAINGLLSGYADEMMGKVICKDEDKEKVRADILTALMNEYAAQFEEPVEADDTSVDTNSDPTTFDTPADVSCES